ncbi:MAG: winged helix-turn-helix transcriptional regulator [Bacteroidales bacterium]|nr:winged helix-turn-helix transcriptional regulator [Bacteroidales bacterium]
MNVKTLTTEQLDTASQILKAMAHPIRVSIMALLEGEKLNVTQIYETLNLEQSVVSHHLGILRDKGVLIAERDGKNVFYSLKSELLSSVIDCVTNCLNEEKK